MTISELSEKIDRIETRNIRLEKKLRNWIALASILGVLLFALAVTGFAYSADRIEDVISVREIEIVDEDGEVRAYFGCAGDTVGIGFFDERETLRSLYFYDDNQRACYLSFLDNDELPRMIFGDAGGGDYVMTVSDDDGNARLTMGYVDDFTGISINDEDGYSVWEVTDE